MTSILFLVAAVVLSVVGCAVFLLRQRKPSSLEHGIDSFSREMEALSPQPSVTPPRGARRIAATPAAPRRRR